MTALQLSVSELLEYWKQATALTLGQSIGAIPLRHMPPWRDLCAELNWKYYRVDRGSFSSKTHDYCGVYRLIALTHEEDITKPATLNRVCGSDASGTLYIGETKSLSSRLNELRRSEHGAIKTLRKIPLLDFPMRRLGIALLSTGKDTRFFERQLIDAYMNSFGDTPPLNYKL